MAEVPIQLHTVVPANLAHRDLTDSQIWNTTLQLEPGKNYHISAPSGSGKTTLARLLYGTQRDFAGTLKWDTKNVKNFALKHWCTIRQSQLAIVFQDLRLFEKLTALENIQVKSDLTHHCSQNDIEAMADQLQTKDLLTRRVGQLSQGERQRVAIIRALCQPYDWIILDEPFSHLDQETADKAATLIKEETDKNEAGIIALQLSGDQFFSYDQKLKL